jgi:hypothetical protein
MLGIPAILSVEFLQPVEPFEKAYRPLAELAIAIEENNPLASCGVCRAYRENFRGGHCWGFSEIQPFRYTTILIP